MPGSYHRNCVTCGQRIQMRQMPAGQWLAFEGYDVVHVCGAASASNSKRSHHEGLTEPQGNRTNDAVGYDGLGFLDFDLQVQAGTEVPKGQAKNRSRRVEAKRAETTVYSTAVKPNSSQSTIPILPPTDTVSPSSRPAVWMILLVVVIAVAAIYLVLQRRAGQKHTTTSNRPSESTPNKTITAPEPKPPSAAEFYQQGLELTKAKKYDEAAAAYQQSIGQDPQMAEAHHELGYVYMQTRQWDKAVGSLKEAIALKPDFAETHKLLGDALSKLAHWDEAIEPYKQAIRMQPNSVHAYLGLGAAYKKLGQTDEAMTAYIKASDLKPNNATAHYELGLLYLELGDLEAAQAEYDLLLPLNPKLAKNLQDALSAY